VDGQIGILKQRMDDRDEAIRVLHETITRTPTEMQQAIGHLADLMVEKFSSVQVQFQERDERAVRESTANTVAVNAAFAAQKEAAAEQNKSNTLAIDKSEIATKEAIQKLAELVQTGMNALSDKQDDAKDQRARLEDRLTRIEAAALGGSAQKTESRDNNRAFYALGGFIISLILASMAVIGFVAANKP
jgi:hypothetical protein